MKTPTRKFTVAVTVLAAGLLPAAHRSQAQSFTLGDLAVEQVGTTGSTTALSSAGTAAYIEEFAPTGTGQTTALQIALPTTASGNQNSLVESGSATSDGYLTRSVNGQYLTLTGYNSTVGAAGVVASSVTRVVGRVDGFGNVDTSTSSATANAANNIRSAASTDGVTIYTTGAGSSSVAPTNLFTFGGTTSTGITTTTSTGTAVTNIRNSEIFTTAVNAQSLYYSTGSGTAGIYMYSGLPTGTAATATLLVTDATGKSPYGFSISPDGKTVYVADDSAAASGGGILKYTSTTGAAGSFTLAYTYSTTSDRGLVVDYSGATPVLYSTNGSTLFSVVDGGTSFTSGTTLATAPTNTAFRGLDFTPTAVPEPATVFAGVLLVGALGWSQRRRLRGMGAKQKGSLVPQA